MTDKQPISEIDALKIINAKLELDLIVLEKKLIDTQQALINARKELNQNREQIVLSDNKKLFAALNLSGDFKLERNDDGTYNLLKNTTT